MTIDSLPLNTENWTVAVYNCKANISFKQPAEVLKIEKKDLKFGKSGLLLKKLAF